MRIFVIDDELALVTRLKRAVIKKCPNDEVYAFTDSTEAYEFAQTHTPDVVFTDIEMPKMTGMTLAKKLKENNKYTKIVFCTAYSEYAVKAFELHANGYLIKPYIDQDIEEELDNILEPHYLPYQKRVFIQTFGNFDVFCDNKIVNFSRAKSKEILAYLVSKKGSAADADELAFAIWEDDTYSEKIKNQIYVYTGDLRTDLDKYGISDILIKTKGGYAINREAVDCDYYRLLDGDVSIINKYEGEFMSQYSWAENINSYIENNI